MVAGGNPEFSGSRRPDRPFDEWSPDRPGRSQASRAAGPVARGVLRRGGRSAPASGSLRRSVLAHARPGIRPDHPAPSAEPPGPVLAARPQRVRGRGRQQVSSSRRRSTEGGDVERGDRRSPGAKRAVPRLARAGRARPGAPQRVRRRRNDLGRTDPRPKRREPEFNDAAVELLADASALFARAVRRGLVAEASRSSDAHAEAPGFVELDDDGNRSGRPPPPSRSSQSSPGRPSRRACVPRRSARSST